MNQIYRTSAYRSGSHGKGWKSEFSVPEEVPLVASHIGRRGFLVMAATVILVELVAASYVVYRHRDSLPLSETVGSGTCETAMQSYSSTTYYPDTDKVSITQPEVTTCYTFGGKD